MRTLAHFGLRSSAGCAPNRMLAAMACALTPPGQRTVIDDSPEAIAAFLRPRPVRELPGVGAKIAATLGEYGLHTVGDAADVPQLTLQRLLGARAGRALHEHAQGRDTTIVDPAPAPKTISTEHRFARDELDPAQHRRALLALADDLGARLRHSGQIASALTCTIRYADQSSTRRSRALPEATQHTVLLARAAYAVYESLGLQRARVRSIALRADALRPDDRATRQLTLDGGDDKPLAIEAVADRARARYGHQVLYPAALAISSRPPPARQRNQESQPEDARGRRAT
ncbi:DNA polymerase Y family protein [Streptomyces flaveus]|uniref:DNA polymerase Y family protein n=1 Tax=Streptomyces flaveus TaxID=66370 RepID=UPI003329E61E